jgi:hypothetical protein
MKATDWQEHSVRGFLSTAAKKHGLKIESTKTEAGDSRLPDQEVAIRIEIRNGRDSREWRLFFGRLNHLFIRPF